MFDFFFGQLLVNRVNAITAAVDNHYEVLVVIQGELKKAGGLFGDVFKELKTAAEMFGDMDERLRKLEGRPSKKRKRKEVQ